MRDLHLLDMYRRTDARVIAMFGTAGNHEMGAFDVPSPTDKAPLLVIASSGLGWDHVSVSRRNRCPNWQEMEYVKRMFFREDETAMQLHVPPSEHVNFADTCLHLWRPLNARIPMPPKALVGAPEVA